ncbi:hypothetical protein [Campylobacter sp. RM16188]|uniref:hypothetical protein n=1 Tax=Campylobacter sp. RM16188 TaxID=1705725 RepID=UPI0015556F5A|nr:hypothetical protein [Campylobacter sp. RM16188]
MNFLKIKLWLESEKRFAAVTAVSFVEKKAEIDSNEIVFFSDENLCFFTGVYDINFKEIYTNHKVKVKKDGLFREALVCFDDKMASFRLDFGNGESAYLGDFIDVFYGLEVVGSILGEESKNKDDEIYNPEDAGAVSSVSSLIDNIFN